MKDREVQLFNPEVIGRKANGEPELACKVVVEGTDLLYYFTNVNEKTKTREFAY